MTDKVEPPKEEDILVTIGNGIDRMADELRELRKENKELKEQIGLLDMEKSVLKLTDGGFNSEDEIVKEESPFAANSTELSISTGDDDGHK